MLKLLWMTMMTVALAHENPLPTGFSYLSEIDSTIQQDVRYAMDHNFVGNPLPGYNKPIIIMTTEAAHALKNIQSELAPFDLGLKVYDAYRPQKCVDEFVRWSENLNDQRMKDEFYPELDKADILGNYVSRRSTHTRGSTVDLTIVPLNSSPQDPWKPGDPLLDGKLPQKKRSPDNSIDMGTGFDYFGQESHTHHPSLSAEIRSNRMLLREIMEKNGFQGIPNEWWHFTLKDEPFPDTYFDFDIE